jgi:hypothetical protein
VRATGAPDRVEKRSGQPRRTFFIMRMRDPDGNLIVFASAEKS